MAQYYTLQRMLQLFGSDATRSALIAAEKSGNIPAPERVKTGTLSRRVWPVTALPTVGEKYGFMQRPKGLVKIAVYSAKGGVFKTSTALNLGRMAALHGIRTCVVGLDFQCDVSRLLGASLGEDSENIDEAIRQIRSRKGLFDLFAGESFERVRARTDIPTLDYIPETAGLISLERTIGALDRREYKLSEIVIDRLADSYDLAIIDCPPSWSHLITNAIVACDVLISPLECKISQFNSLSVFVDHLKTFRKTMKLKYEHIFVPTRYMPSRRLSVDIRNWYLSNLPRVSTGVVRESAVGEEATASRKSLPEHAPHSHYADEMRDLLREIWSIAVAEPKTNAKQRQPAGKNTAAGKAS